MIEVETDDHGGLNGINTRNMVINLQLYDGALNKCNQTIVEYNKTVNGVN